MFYKVYETGLGFLHHLELGSGQYSTAQHNADGANKLR